MINNCAPQIGKLKEFTNCELRLEICELGDCGYIMLIPQVIMYPIHGIPLAEFIICHNVSITSHNVSILAVLRPFDAITN